MPDAIPFHRPAPVRLARRRIINDTSIRSIKPPVSGAVDCFDDLTPGRSLRVTSKDVGTLAVRGFAKGCNRAFSGFGA